MTKPRLRLVDGQPVPAPLLPAIAQAREKFGRDFAHHPAGNWLEYPEPTLSRWARRADYFNLDPKKPRPSPCTLHFHDNRSKRP